MKALFSMLSCDFWLFGRNFSISHPNDSLFSYKKEIHSKKRIISVEPCEFLFDFPEAFSIPNLRFQKFLTQCFFILCFHFDLREIDPLSLLIIDILIDLIVNVLGLPSHDA